VDVHQPVPDVADDPYLGGDLRDRGFFVVCVFSLFFLLAKEDKTQGWVQVAVQAPGFVHTTWLPVYSAHQVRDYMARVDYARSLSAASSR
jgi:hypothetical protein